MFKRLREANWFRSVELLGTLWSLGPLLLAVLLIVAGLFFGFVGLFTRFSLFAKLLIALGAAIAVLYAVDLWRSRVRGWVADHCQSTTPEAHEFRLRLRPPNGTESLAVECRVEGQGFVAKAPKIQQHREQVAHLNTAAARTAWVFPYHFDYPGSFSARHGRYNVTWTALRSGRRVVVAKDSFLIWPDGVYRARALCNDAVDQRQAGLST